MKTQYWNIGKDAEHRSYCHRSVTHTRMQNTEVTAIDQSHTMNQNTGVTAIDQSHTMDQNTGVTAIDQ